MPERHYAGRRRTSKPASDAGAIGIDSIENRDRRRVVAVRGCWGT
jgi:hypothetical protein